MADGTLAHSPTLVSPSTRGDAGGEDLAPGTSVGEYVVERFLGAGAMGEVYAGKQPVIGKKVAIKVLKREVGASADGAERFTREARAVNQVDHPGVIDIFSFGRLDDGRLYLVMDLVEGQSLRKALVDGPLPVPMALDVLAQIASALDAAHARGVVHRDLKPDNVMLQPGSDPAAAPKVFVLDFGLAKLLSTEGNTKVSMLTGQGTWLGTPGYMAPEQWSADGAGPASDRYALGVIAFELLSGSLPFQAQSLPQMMEQHFRAKVPALSARGAVAAHAAFDPVVSRAMAKDPDQRFPSAKDMVEALRAVAGGNAPKAAAASGKRTWVPAALGAGVLALSVGAVLAVRGGTERTRTSPSPAPVAAGMVRIEILSIPPGAEVRRGGALVGLTPASLEVPAGEPLAFELRKPGYATRQERLALSDGNARAPEYRLEQITKFEGVWALPDGQLRAFKRTGEKVAVSKLDTVEGPQTFYRHFDFVNADTGVTFVTTEEYVHEAAPNHPSCHIPRKVQYHYEPASDAFDVRREDVQVDVVSGACVIRTSELTAPLVLARADHRTTSERLPLPPVGKPIVSNVNDANDAVGKTVGKPVEPKLPPPNRGKGKGKVPPTRAGDFDASDLGNIGKQLDAPPRQQVVKPPAQQAAEPPAQQRTEPEPQQQANPQPQAPQFVTAPARGDSQMAPPVPQKK